jgi:hypothetical protein
MISTIAIGLIDYPLNQSLEKIECAYQDAQRFYNTLEQHFKNNFNSYNSICINNIKEITFLTLLDNYYKSLFDEDIFFLFISGHGVLEKNELYLEFHDSNGSGEGRISSNTLKEKLSKIKAHTVLILDTCHSGVGLKLARNNFIFGKSKISVLCSSEASDLANFTCTGSLYTNALCQSIIEIANEGQEVSLINMVRRIRAKKVKCLSTIEEGEQDLVITNNKNNEVFDLEFVQRIVERLCSENNSTKEMLWYAIIDLPLYVKKNIMKAFFSGSENKNEGSWLVRRAIGSFISSIMIDSTVGYKELIKLLKSQNWMEQCIALNSLKFNFNEEVANLTKDILLDQQKPMNLVWLANLYLSDSQYPDIIKSLQSNLGKTKWGIFDIYSRFKSHFESDELVSMIKLHCLNEDLLEYIYFETKNDKVINSEVYHNLRNSKIFNYIENSSNRGKIQKQDLNKKWLLSILFGSWRDQKKLDLKIYLDNYTKELICKELQEARHFPMVENRMAILSYFEFDKSNFVIYKDFLRWSINDYHPWVTEIALRLFSEEKKSVELILNKNIDSFIYPGLIDLLITGKNLGIDINPFIGKYGFTKNEMKSLIN